MRNKKLLTLFVSNSMFNYVNKFKTKFVLLNVVKNVFNKKV